MRRFKTIRGHISEELRGAVFEVMARDGGAPPATIARHKGRVVEVNADQSPSNDSTDSADGLGLSGDGDNSGDGDSADRDAA